ncbi:MAG: hypothetical protein ACXAC2_09080 [Candidatus Kariarchaeaceae archaeon]|jgi:hypothetical protein
MGDISITKAQILRLQTPLDLLRLVVSNAQNRGAFVYYGLNNGKHILAISHLVPGWYNLRGLPITLIAEIPEAPKTDIIRYRFASDDGEEEWEFVDNFTSDSKYVFLPIVKIAEFPDFLL